MITEAAILTTARTVPWPVGVIATLLPVPAIIVAVTGGDDYTGALLAASLIAGAGAGYAFDDAAAATLAAAPVPLSTRRLLRATAVFVVLLGAWLIALSVAGVGAPAGATLAFPVAELAATAAVSLALAGRAPTDAPVSTGFGAAVGALLTMVVIGSLAQRLEFLPMLMAARHTERWWFIAAIALAAAGWWSRDPATGKAFRR